MRIGTHETQAASVKLRDPPGDRQPKARAAAVVWLRAISAKKSLEDPSLIRWRNARAGVAHSNRAENL